MVTLGHVRVNNYTQYQRQGWVTCVLPLADQRYWPLDDIQQQGRPFGEDGAPPTSGPLEVTAIDTSLATGHALRTQKVQAYPMGPRYPSGNIMYLRLIFFVEMPAGVFNSLYSWYDYYASKDIEITNDTTAGATWTVHSQVLADIGTTSFEVNIPNAPDGTPDDRTLSWDLTPATLGFYEYDKTNDVTTQNVRCFRYPIRLFPRNNREPSWWGILWFEIPHEQRLIKWWLQIGHGWAIDSLNHYHRVTYLLPKPSTTPTTGSLDLVITGPSVKIYNDHPTIQVGPTVASTVTTYELINQHTITNRNGDAFPAGQCLNYHGVLSFEGGSPTTLEQDSASAEKEVDLQAIATTWGDHETWGAYRELPRRPQNSLIQSDQDAYERALEQADNDMTEYDSWSRDPYHRALHTEKPNAPGTGPSPGYGACKLFWLARGVAPDWRGSRISMYQDAGKRQYTYRETQLQIVRCTNHTGQTSDFWTDIFLWWMRPFRRNERYPNSLNHLVPPTAFHFGLGEQAAISRSLPWNREPTSSGLGHWQTHRHEHWDCHYMGNWTLMTGDRLMLEQCEVMSELLVAVMPHQLDTKRVPWAMSGFWSELRGNSRIEQSAASLYWVTGSPDIFRQMNLRWVAVTSQFWRGRNQTNQDLLVTGGESTSSGVPVREPSFRVVWEAFQLASWMAIYYITGIEAIKTAARRLAWSMTHHATRRNTDSNNRWQFSNVQQIDPDGNAWQPLTDAQKFDNVRDRNGTGLLYAEWDQTLARDWCAAAIVFGYRFAVEEGNDAWQNLCREMFEHIIGTREANRGAYGWGSRLNFNQHENNSQEWAGYTEDAWFMQPADQYRRATANVTPNVAAITADGQTDYVSADCDVTPVVTAFFAKAGVDAVPDTIAGGGSLTVTGSATITALGHNRGTTSAIASLTGSATLTADGDDATPRRQLSEGAEFDPELVVDLLPEGDAVTLLDQTITIVAGDDTDIIYVTRDRTGERINIDQATEISWVLRTSVSAANVLLKKLTTGGIAILNQDTNRGEFRVTLTAEETKAITGDHFKEVEMQLPGSNRTLWQGTATMVETALIP